VNFIDALSVHASIAIENARLYEQERQKLRMEKELFAAREVQMSLVPQQLPQIPEFEFAGYTMPAREVGGDYFDFIRIDEHLLAVSLGDVSGKGLPAALLMANAQATVRGQSLSTRSAKECLERSNKFLFQSSASDKFVTLFYAILDSQNHQLLFSNAGHEHPFLFSAAKEPLRLSTGGIMLGIIDDVPFQEEMVPFEPGATLVVFSDGITEAMNETKEQYGDTRLAHVVRKHITESPADLVERIIHSVTSYVGSAPQMDDMTLVVIKRKKE
jgi:sigma-B regulation protein RsbU (phosphoserine phosphatase)